MIRLPSYLQRNPHGIFYFRTAIPISLRAHLGRSEIKCSLRTRCKVEAIDRARPFSHSIRHLYVRLSDMTFKEARELLQRYLAEQPAVMDRYLETHGPMPVAEKIAFQMDVAKVRDRAALDIPNPAGVKLAQALLQSQRIQLDPTSSEFRRLCVQSTKALVAQMEAFLIKDAEYNRQYGGFDAREALKTPGGRLENVQRAPGSAAPANNPGIETESGSSQPGLPSKRRMPRRKRTVPAPHLNRIGTVPSVASAPYFIGAISGAIAQGLPVAAPVYFPPQQQTPTVSQALAVYSAEKCREGSWTEKTEKTTRGMFDLFIRIVGDVAMKEIGPTQARDYKQVLQKLPANLNVKPLYRSKTIAQILEMKPEQGMSVVTVNNHLSWISALFDWGERNGYVDKNPFRKMSLKNPKRPDEARAAYTPQDLRTLFSTEQYTGHRFKHPHYYWLPLLGLHSGARLNELCQLHLKDIRQEDGIWVLDINESEPDQRVKTRSARRLVPIHPKLIDLGLLRFVEEQKQTGSVRLFPELKLMRDGVSQAASKWFARYRQQLGMYNQKPKRDFHSFRTTLINELKQKGHPQPMVAAIVGHATEGLTFGTYGKAYLPSVLIKVLADVDFSPVLSGVRNW